MTKMREIGRFVYRNGKGISWETSHGNGELLARVIDAGQPTEAAAETLRKLESRVKTRMDNRQSPVAEAGDLDFRVRRLIDHYGALARRGVKSKSAYPPRASVVRRCDAFLRSQMAKLGNS